MVTRESASERLRKKSKMETQPFVYGLYDPLDACHIRYVGMAPSNPMRPYAHASRARSSADDSYLLRWIRKIQVEGREPKFVILEQLPEDTGRMFLGFVESCYIKSLRAIGHRLTNENNGGWGGSNGPHTPESRMAMRASWTPELRARIGAIVRERETGKTHSEETRAKHRAVFTPELRAKIGAEAKARNTGLVRSEEVKARISASLVGRAKTPEECEKNRNSHFGKQHSKKTKLKMSESRKGNTNALGFKHSEETKAKRSAALKAAWARRKKS